MGLFSRLVAFFMILVLSPLLILIALCSLMFQGAPILFRQERIGFRFQPFQLVKFRSMTGGNRSLKITDAKDSRITGWGEILRATKLDELPQLWNILKGEMRFIGPRPEVEEFFNREAFAFLETVKLVQFPGRRRRFDSIRSQSIKQSINQSVNYSIN